MRGFSQPLTLLSFGSGTVGMHNMDGGTDMNKVIVLATPAEGENFIGWYEDGSLVSTELEYRHTGGGKLYACFAGDADGNGQINTVDATLIMRAALGYTSVNNFSMMDVDADGNIAVADALAVLRVSLGL
ncbi:MAG: dockerin type I domain-containing protein [Eubacteriales bacterium]|nr:dockerin type I domain-containing protein [Eubacteriales bacterium]